MHGRRFFRRREKDAEVQEEMIAFLAEEMEENIARGMPEKEALRQAKIKLGNPQQIRESLWKQHSWMFLENRVKDLRYALWQLLKIPGFTLTTILSSARLCCCSSLAVAMRQFSCLPA
jgi:putative ABC transport system permease protein